MPRISQADLNKVAKTLEDRSPADLLRWASSTFGSRLTTISAMQQSGSVVACMIAELGLQIPILFVDTGVMFQETLDTRDRMISDYGVTVRTLKPVQTMEEQIRERGILYLSPEGQQECCHARKVDPLHSQGYSTIGCNRCTTPVLPGEPKRAGRWRHLGPWSMYCGINPTDTDDGTLTYAELPQDLIDRVLGQKTDFMI